MKIIFSRKGFDSGTGSVPSPIMADGTMITLPIPDLHGTVTYSNLTVAGHNLGKLITDLKGKRRSRTEGLIPLDADDCAHLDPDLLENICTRTTPTWKAALGQCGSAAGVLHNHNIGIGDIFLFFGWFRQCEVVDGVYRYVRGAQNIHVLFGYLRVGSIIQIGTDPIPEWAQQHPHLHGVRQGRNILYVAADSLGLPGAEHLPGAGTFQHFTQALQLTAPGVSGRSIWQVPQWMYPDGGKPPLSSHEKISRWQQPADKSQEFCQLEAVARGQEFVLDTAYYPEADSWATEMIRKSANL